MKTKRKFLQIFTLCFCLVFVAVGCGSNNTNTNNGTSTQKPLDSTSQTGTANNNTGTNNGVTTTDSERRVLADRICRSVEKIDGVQDATVLIADASNNTTATNHNTGSTSNNTGSTSNNTGSTGTPTKTSNETNTSGTGTTSGTSGAINNTNTGSNTGTNNSTGPNNSNSNTTGNNTGSGSNNGTTMNATPGNSNGPYVAIVGVTFTDTIQADNAKQNSLAQTIRQMILQEENVIQEVIITTDENDIQHIGNLANNMMENTNTDASDEVNRLRDDLMNAGTNLVNSARDITNGIGNGIKELAR